MTSIGGKTEDILETNEQKCELISDKTDSKQELNICETNEQKSDEIKDKTSDELSESDVRKCDDLSKKSETIETFVNNMNEEYVYDSIEPEFNESNDKTADEVDERVVIESTETPNNSDEPQVIPFCDECGDCFESEMELEIHLNSCHKTIEPFVPTISEPNHSLNSVNIKQKLSEEKTPELITNNNNIDWNSVESTDKTIDNTNFSLITELFKNRTKFAQNNSNLVILNQNNNPFNYDFRCTQCQKYFATKGFLSNHLSEVHIIPAFECDLCDYKSLKMGGLLSHKAFHTLQDVECNECQMKFISQKALKNHLSKSHEISEFKCDFCSFKALNKTSLNTHINKKHKNDVWKRRISALKPYENIEIPTKTKESIELNYMCSESSCGQRFQTKGLLNTHKARDHLIIANRSYVCNTIAADNSTCIKSFETTQQLLLHRKTHQQLYCKAIIANNVCNAMFYEFRQLVTHKQRHNRNHPFCCKALKCRHQFKTKQEFLEHTKSVHPMYKLYMCSHNSCNLWFKTCQELASHKATEHPLISTISDCDKTHNKHNQTYGSVKTAKKTTINSTNNESNSDSDIEIISEINVQNNCPKNYVCNVINANNTVCNKAFETIEQLDRHNSTFHWVLCTGFGCKKRFKTRDELLKHRNFCKHSPEKRFKCPFNGCKLRFETPKQMSIHRKKSHRRVGCNVKGCGKTFMKRETLNKHMKQFHSKDKRKYSNKSVINSQTVESYVTQNIIDNSLNNKLLENSTNFETNMHSINIKSELITEFDEQNYALNPDNIKQELIEEKVENNNSNFKLITDLLQINSNYNNGMNVSPNGTVRFETIQMPIAKFVNYVNHNSGSSGTTRGELKCNVNKCNKVFKNYYYLRKHKSIEHSMSNSDSERRNKCVKTYKSKSGLIRN